MSRTVIFIIVFHHHKPVDLNSSSSSCYSDEDSRSVPSEERVLLFVLCKADTIDYSYVHQSITKYLVIRGHNALPPEDTAMEQKSNICL
jgi:hypothetical protein